MKNKKTICKKKFKITEYQLLLIAIAIFILQDTTTNTIQIPLFLDCFFIILAIFITIVIKKTKKEEFCSLSKFLGFFGSFFVYYVLTLGIGFFIFGIINNIYSKNKEIECSQYKIIRAYEHTRRSPDDVEILLNSKECHIVMPISKKMSKLIHDKEALNRSYLFLCYKKGLWGTYIIKQKEIVIE